LDEIETVLAHELGHHVHKDIPFLIAFGTLSTTLSLFIASLALDYAVGFFSFTSPADIAAFPALMLILSAYGLLTSPIDNAVSRWRENMADDYAYLTRRARPCLRLQDWNQNRAIDRNGWSSCSTLITFG
jgi:STE24 endopeptidase